MTHDYPRLRSQFLSRYNEEKLVAVSWFHPDIETKFPRPRISMPWVHVKIIATLFYRDDRYIFPYLRHRRLNSSRLFYAAFTSVESFLFNERDRFYIDERALFSTSTEKREGCVKYSNVSPLFVITYDIVFSPPPPSLSNGIMQ